MRVSMLPSYVEKLTELSAKCKVDAGIGSALYIIVSVWSLVL